MSEEFGRGLDPVPAEWRFADPERDARARELEQKITFEIHSKFDEPEGEGDPFEERVHYVSGPPDADGNTDYGFISKGAGVWWYRPPFREVETTYGPEGITSEEEAKTYARRRVAWNLAGET